MLARWVARTGYGIAQLVPGVKAAELALRQIERAALRELRKRMDAADPARSASPSQELATTTDGDVTTRHAAMAELLQRSLSRSVDQAREELFGSTLSRLTSDEARILAALSDGTPFALVDVVERAGMNGARRQLVCNACTVGRAAGLALPDQVHVYVTRLRALDLVVVGDESPELNDQYEILHTEQVVRSALASARRTKVIRRTLRISAFGAAFWVSCDPSILR